MAELVDIGGIRGGARPSSPAPSPPERPHLSADLPPGLSTFRIETWGCQMNAHDTEKMAGILGSFGLTPARDERDADIILLNTCSVREKAAHKVFTRLGQLRRYKRSRPDMVLGVCGCVAQQEQARIFERAPFVDLVMGPRMIADLPDLIRQSRENRRALGVFDPRDTLLPEVDVVARMSRTRAFVTVMEGCNKTCTFCIVPSTRGREINRLPSAILAEVDRCAAGGLCEIEVLGQNVNAWWKSEEGRRWDFASLLEAVALRDGVRRVRFTTSHPLHFRDPIIEAMARQPRICRHLHLPVQSGSDQVLLRMNRGYTRAHFLDRVARLRARVPDVALSTDFIVGFPGETEEDFARTISLVEEVRFDSAFSFIYSPRPGTPAAGLPDDVPRQRKLDRLYRLQELQEGIQVESNRAWVGRVVEVLIEGPSARSNGQMSGRTSQNVTVNLEADPGLVGRLVPVMIERAGRHSLHGVLQRP